MSSCKASAKLMLLLNTKSLVKPRQKRSKCVF